MKKIILFIVSLVCIEHACAINVDKKVNDLWLHLSESASNPEQEVDALAELADFYVVIYADYEMADSLAKRAIKIASSTKNNQLKAKAYETYFSGLNTGFVNQEAIDYANEFTVLAEKSENQRLIWLAKYYQSESLYNAFRFQEALSILEQVSSLTSSINDTSLMVSQFVQKGRCYEKLNDKLEALSYFLQALDLANQTGDYEQKLEALSALAMLFHFNNNLEKALDYRKKRVEVILQQEHIDTLLYISDQFYFIELNLLLGRMENPERQLDSMLIYTKSMGFQAFHARTWSLYRSYLIPRNKFKKLFELYNEMFPDELEKIKEENQDLFLRLNAYFYEYKGELEKADQSWMSVLERTEEQTGLYYKSHRFLRYTEFLLRNNRLSDASKYALTAFDIASEANYKEFQLDALRLLQVIFAKQGEFEKAYDCSLRSEKLAIDLIKTSNEEGLLVVELRHDNDRKQIVQQRAEAQRQAEMRETTLKANAFGVGLVVFLLLSAVVFRQYKQTRKEKNRSDELLLNILPLDTANELKQTGLTTARLYNEVSILFCDIVGFTNVAEVLSPQDLVKEIDTYFRAFDEVVGKHGMEKIKTVGDAYVAVGGMPLKNEAEASDVVRAAIDMLNEVDKLRSIRRAENRPAFELRVGIHTGSVVAGVVGSKKFQYDIWGDAVNIAARMEQNSEPGKINISEATYGIVKNEFKCTSRGKIEAKNKGLIAMYFIEA